jgi:antitoxin CptB
MTQMDETRDRARERIRWHCRRGMLELDLVLGRFLEHHFDALDAPGVDAFTSLLERTDPELLDLVMGHAQAHAGNESRVLALIRNA